MVEPLGEEGERVGAREDGGAAEAGAVGRLVQLFVPYQTTVLVCYREIRRKFLFMLRMELN